MQLPKPKSWRRFLFRHLPITTVTLFVSALVIYAIGEAIYFSESITRLATPIIFLVPLTFLFLKFYKQHQAQKIYDYMKVYSIAVECLKENSTELKEFNELVSEQLKSLNPTRLSDYYLYVNKKVSINTVERHNHSFNKAEPDEQSMPPDYDGMARVYAPVYSFPSSELHAWRESQRLERKFERISISTSVASLVFLGAWILLLDGGERLQFNANFQVLFTLFISFTLIISFFVNRRRVEVLAFRRVIAEREAEEKAAVEKRINGQKRAKIENENWLKKNLELREFYKEKQRKDQEAKNHLDESDKDK